MITADAPKATVAPAATSTPLAPVRVALDIGLSAAWNPGSKDKVGVTRAIDAIVTHLHRRKDVQLTVMGICGDEPLYYSYLTRIFPTGDWDNGVAVAHSIESRLGLFPLYDRLLPAYINDVAGVGTSSKLSSTIVRALVKLGKIVDAQPVFDSAAFDVVFSTGLSLPSPERTHGTPRALLIYDLISVRHPEWVTEMQKANQQQIVDSVDPKRDWVICNAESVRQDICDYMKIAPERVFAVPLGASENFHPVADPIALQAVRKKYGIPAGDYLLALAAFQPRKNIARTIGAFAHLLREHPEQTANLVIAGKRGQSHDEILNALGDSETLQKRIIFTGYVADEDLSALYSGAYAFVFPSLAEGFGLPALEAMCCRTPVIASNVTSLPEIVGDAGIQVDPLSEVAIADAMQALLGDSALRERLAQAGFERSRQFTWEHCAEGLVDAFRSILNHEKRQKPG